MVAINTTFVDGEDEDRDFFYRVTNYGGGRMVFDVGDKMMDSPVGELDHDQASAFSLLMAHRQIETILMQALGTDAGREALELFNKYYDDATRETQTEQGDNE